LSDLPSQKSRNPNSKQFIDHGRYDGLTLHAA
jgi:hypothetical protein